MASKTKKGQASTSVQSPEPSSRPYSPLSPSRKSRIQEKHELQNLNDRLAAYIDKVRSLEAENDKLRLVANSYEETATREVSSVKSMYESELADSRKLLDRTAKERAQSQIENAKLKDELADLKERLGKREKEFASVSNQLATNTARLNDLEARLNQALADRRKFEDENKDLKSQRDKLAKQLESLRKDLDDETLTRVDLENQMQSLKEELTFREQLFEKEMTETKTRKQVEITEIDGRLQQEYDQKLADSLRDLRDQYEQSILENRADVENMYERKIDEQNRALTSDRDAANRARDELRQVQTSLHSYMTKTSEMEALVKGLQDSLREKEKIIQGDRDRFEAEIRRLEEQLRESIQQRDDQAREYQDLMDVKVALDMEIAAYRKLLESEESRLNITPSRLVGEGDMSVQQTTRGGSASRSTPTMGYRGIKRKRTVLSESSEASSSHANVMSSSTSSGDVEIDDQDVEGKYIKLYNKGNKDIPIGGWQLVRMVNDHEVYYKFHRNIVLKAGQYITVWSSDAGATHQPPTNLVMKGQRWLSGKELTSKLINGQSEEMAARKTYAGEQSASTTFSRYSLGGSDPVHEQLFHQQGDPQTGERCSIM